MLIVVFFALLLLFTGGFSELSPSIPSIVHIILLTTYAILPLATVMLLQKQLSRMKEMFWRAFMILSVPCLFKSLVISSVLILIYVAVRVLLLEGNILKFPPQSGFYATSSAILIAWILYIRNILRALSGLALNLNS